MLKLFEIVSMIDRNRVTDETGIFYTCHRPSLKMDIW